MAALRVPRQTLTGHCGIGLIEDLAAAPLPQALADLARLHPGATLELVSAPGPAMREAFTTGRLHVALCDPTYLPEPPRWTVRLPMVWAAGPGFDLSGDPLPLVLFSQPCRWRAPLLDSLDAAGRAWRIVFEGTSLSGVTAAVQAGLGVTALNPANLTTGMTSPELPDLPDVELGLVRRSDTAGDPLVDAVEALLRQLV